MHRRLVLGQSAVDLTPFCNPATVLTSVLLAKPPSDRCQSMFPILFLLLCLCYASSSTVIEAKLNGTASIPLPQAATYRRQIPATLGNGGEHIFTVCNGKNKAKCGFWQNVKTKKKVARNGATTYNKKKKALIVKKFTAADMGTYMTGNKKKSVNVLISVELPPGSVIGLGP